MALQWYFEKKKRKEKNKDYMFVNEFKTGREEAWMNGKILILSTTKKKKKKKQIFTFSSITDFVLFANSGLVSSVPAY